MTGWIRWFGDERYGHCSACGKPATAGEDPDDWWHCYSVHIATCPDLTGGVFVEEGRFDTPPTTPAISDPAIP